MLKHLYFLVTNIVFFSPLVVTKYKEEGGVCVEALFTAPANTRLPPYLRAKLRKTSSEVGGTKEKTHQTSLGK